MPGSINKILSPTRAKALDEFRFRDPEGAERQGVLRNAMMLETQVPGSLRTERRFGEGGGSLKSFQALAGRKTVGEGSLSLGGGQGAIFASDPSSASWVMRVGRFFRGLYRQWARGPHGFLLMGASFLLSRDPAFETDHPLDLVHSLEPGWPGTHHPELEEITGPLSRVLGSSREGVFLVLKDPTTRLWLLQGNEWQSRLLGDRMQLEPGAVFAVGEKPRWANRGGYSPEKTRVYRFDPGQDPAGRWKVVELAHANDQMEDFLIRQLHRRFSFVSDASLHPAVRAMVRQAEALGGDEATRIAFLKENILESITAITLGAMRLTPVPLLDFLRQVFAEYQAEEAAAPVFEFSERLLLNFFLLVNPPQQPQRILEVVHKLRGLGYQAKDLPLWVENFERVPLNFLESIAQIPDVTKKVRALGLDRESSERKILEIMEGFEERDEVAPPEVIVAIVKLSQEGGWSAEEALELAFQARGHLKAASDAAVGGDLTPLRWDDQIYWSHVLNHAARFGAYLKGFGVPPESSREVLMKLIGAYREAVVPTMIELMTPEYEVFFEHWQRTFPEFLEEMQRYFPGKN